MSRAQQVAETRARLLRAGERLFAERGIHQVRLREINALAGQRNSSALHYHFGDRDGLAVEIMRVHLEAIEARRVPLVAAITADGRTGDVRSCSSRRNPPAGAPRRQARVRVAHSPPRRAR